MTKLIVSRKKTEYGFVTSFIIVCTERIHQTTFNKKLLPDVPKYKIPFTKCSVIFSPHNNVTGTCLCLLL